MPTIRSTCPDDRDEISRLHAHCFGPGRFTRTAYRIRESANNADAFSWVLHDGDRLIASVRLSEVVVGGQTNALLLGPIAVDPDEKGKGHGATLLQTAIEAAKSKGYKLIVLVGDMAFYGRFGFVVSPPGQIFLPGPVDPARILTLELEPGASENCQGLIRAKA